MYSWISYFDTSEGWNTLKGYCSGGKTTTWNVILRISSERIKKCSLGYFSFQNSIKAIDLSTTKKKLSLVYWLIDVFKRKKRNKILQGFFFFFSFYLFRYLFIIIFWFLSSFVYLCIYLFLSLLKLIYSFMYLLITKFSGGGGVVVLHYYLPSLPIMLYYGDHSQRCTSKDHYIQKHTLLKCNIRLRKNRNYMQEIMRLVLLHEAFIWKPCQEQSMSWSKRLKFQLADALISLVNMLQFW